jgi:hypothetical protein
VDYVMVPVPEELAPKVLRYISWRGHPLLVNQATGEGDDTSEGSGSAAEGDVRGTDPVARVFARLDSQGRTLLTVTATASIAGQKLTVAETAQRAGLSEREVIGVITEVNNLVAGAGGSPVTVLVAGAEGAEDAAFSWERRIVLMGEPIARGIADLASASAD